MTQFITLTFLYKGDHPGISIGSETQYGKLVAAAMYNEGAWVDRLENELTRNGIDHPPHPYSHPDWEPDNA